MTRPALLLIGLGGLGSCTLPLLLRHLEVRPQDVLVVEPAPTPQALEVLAGSGVAHLAERVTRTSYPGLLDRVCPGGLVVDLAYDLDTVDLLHACAARSLRYVNASVEVWDPYAPGLDRAARTLHARHARLRQEVSGWTDRSAPSAVLDHGANPGLVSHFTKAALADLAAHWLDDPARRGDLRRDRVQQHLRDEQFGRLARVLGVKVVHISERDTQLTTEPKRVNEFVNTWSVEGLYEEATAPAELGWGTHERTVPLGALRVGHQLALATAGARTLVRSWVPAGEIVGLLIRHGEAFSIAEHLTVHDEDGTELYRPTVHYAYCLTDSAMASLHELWMRRDVLQPQRRVLLGDVSEGADQFGVLLGGHDYGAWWYGCLLDVSEARRVVPGTNATLLPVAAGVLAAALWTERKPRAGVHLPDTLPWREVLADALPYCGPMASLPVRWSPVRGVHDGEVVDNDWQFGNVLA
jgi:homospermidine synthase